MGLLTFVARIWQQIAVARENRRERQLDRHAAPALAIVYGSARCGHCGSSDHTTAQCGEKS